MLGTNRKPVPRGAMAVVETGREGKLQGVWPVADVIGCFRRFRCTSATPLPVFLFSSPVPPFSSKARPLALCCAAVGCFARRQASKQRSRAKPSCDRWSSGSREVGTRGWGGAIRRYLKFVEHDSVVYRTGSPFCFFSILFPSPSRGGSID